MSQPPRIAADLLDRYFAGQCTPDEVVHVQSIIALNPQLAMLQRGVQGEPVDVAAAWSRFRQSSAPEPGKPTSPSAKHVGTGLVGKELPLRKSLRRMMYAATAIAVIGMSTYAITNRVLPTAYTSPHTYTTTVGQFATIRLADGSRITLAPRTTVTIAADRRTHDRLVSLVGQARFEVVPSRGATFMVRTGAVTMRVLGTAFDIRRYSGDITGQIVVRDGKVSVVNDRSEKPTVLTAGMIGRFTDSVIATTTTVDPTLYTDWTQGRLVFTDTPIPVFLATLRLWYGYQFRLADSALAAQHVTVTFQLGDRAEMMRRLKQLLGVRMTFADSVVTLLPDRDPEPSPKSIHHNVFDPYPSTEVGR